MLTILWINNGPMELSHFASVFTRNKIHAEFHRAKTEPAARKFLEIAGRKIDIVFIGYTLGGEGGGPDTLRTGLVQAFVAAGFGKCREKMLVAMATSMSLNNELIGAGCSHRTTLEGLDFFIKHNLVPKDQLRPKKSRRFAVR